MQLYHSGCYNRLPQLPPSAVVGGAVWDARKYILPWVWDDIMRTRVKADRPRSREPSATSDGQQLRKSVVISESY